MRTLQFLTRLAIRQYGFQNHDKVYKNNHWLLKIAPALIYNLQSNIYKKNNNIFYEKTEMRFRNARTRSGVIVC